MVGVTTWTCRLTEAGQPFRFFLFSDLRIPGQVTCLGNGFRHGNGRTRTSLYAPCTSFMAWRVRSSRLSTLEYLRGSYSVSGEAQWQSFVIMLIIAYYPSRIPEIHLQRPIKQVQRLQT